MEIYVRLTVSYLYRGGTKYVDYILDTTVPAAGETLRNGAALRWFLRKIDELEIAGVRSRRYFWEPLTYTLTPTGRNERSYGGSSRLFSGSRRLRR